MLCDLRRQIMGVVKRRTINGMRIILCGERGPAFNRVIFTAVTAVEWQA